jgi:hypothetical protein
MDPDAGIPRASRRRSRRFAVCALLLASLGQMGNQCVEVDVPGSLVEVTLNAVPKDLDDLLVVPPSGFTLDVRLGDPAEISPGSLWVGLVPFDSGSSIDLTGHLVVTGPQSSVVVVPPEKALPPGSYTAFAAVFDLEGRIVFDRLAFAVRPHPGSPPLGGGQWIQLDFQADRDGNGAPDLADDLVFFGLGTAADPLVSAVVRDWVEEETLLRAQAFYSIPNPSQLPQGDAVELVFSAAPPASGPFTRICVGGQDPAGGLTIGNVLFDPRNASRSESACDNVFATGIFPRELLSYAFESSFQAAFASLLEQPAGSHPLDAIVLGDGFDPGDPAQAARRDAIAAGVEVLAQALGSIAAHETGHAVGLVPPGPPGGGLHGGGSGSTYAHDVTPEGSTPAESYLMNEGASFSFGELTGAGGQPLPRWRETDFAYLRGRLVLDAKVTGIFSAPKLTAVAPASLSKSNGYLATLTVDGARLRATPTIRLRGPLVHTLLWTQLVSDRRVTGTAVLPQLVAGSYDLELTNPDGQVALLRNAVLVAP